MSSTNDLLLCPLTHQRFVDPVIDKEGNSYERSAIMEWLKENKNSPITRSRLRPSDLRPNRSVQQLIENMEDTTPTGNKVSKNSIKKKSKIISETQPYSDQIIRMIVQDGKNEKGKQKCITIIPDENGSRCPVNIVLVIDVSGSMAYPADIPGCSESSGLTTLDVVKHAAKTVIHILEECDRCSIVQFTNKATLICKDVIMDEEGKRMACDKLAEMVPLFSTNIWGGLEMALQTLLATERKHQQYFSSVFLLTDGVPNIIPKNGHVRTLEEFQNKHASARKISIYTFGFGYNLKSDILKKLAVRGQGHYGFIPDPGMVGTVFVHALSNLLTTAAQHTRITLYPAKPKEDIWHKVLCLQSFQKNFLFKRNLALPKWITKIYGKYDHETSRQEVSIDMGSLRFGQPRTFIVDLADGQNDFFVSMSYTSLGGHIERLCYNGPDNKKSDSKELSEIDIVENKLRLLSVEALEAASTTIDVSNDYSAAQNIIANMIDLYRQHRLIKSGLALDLAGEVTLAVSSENNFKKWGVHYLPSLGLSHLLQVCSNFKDAGMQEYSKGDLFQQIRDEADDLFVGLPPPLPSRKINARMSLNSMSSYHNAAGPCFAGHCRVSMADGSFLPIELLRKGDCVICPSSGEVATVACIIATRCQNSQCGMVRLPGTKLDVTPYHPIRLNGKWTFPINVAGAIFETLTNCEVIYSFILENPTVHVSLKIEGMECLGLAHQIIGDPVASHPFFGTNRVIDDLRPLGYESGLVTFDSDCVVRGDDGNMRQVVTSFNSSRLLPSQKIIF